MNKEEMKKEIKRKYLISIIRKILETNIELMTYYKHYATDEKSKRTCSKSIRKTKKALEILPHIQHTEILQSLFNAIISGKEVIFVSAGFLVCGKNVERWDSTEKGFKEFMKLEEEAVKKAKEKAEEEQKQREIIAKAKAEGKKVEMVYDKNTKTVKPLIIEEKSQA